MPVLESSVYGLWAGKQSAKGTPNTTPAHRLIQVGGDFGFARDDGTERYSDLSMYGSNTDWVNSLTGQGEPVLEASPDELAFLLWAFHGAETVTSVTGPPTAQRHEFVPSSGQGHWLTFFRRAGRNTRQNMRMSDCIVNRITIEGGRDAKAVRVMASVLSLTPGVTYATDPSAGLPTDKTFLFTDGSGAFTMNGTAYSELSSWQVVLDAAWTPVYGDSTSPIDIVQGSPSVSVSASMLFTTAGLARWNTEVYGSSSPATGTAPSSVIPSLGSFAWDLKQRTNVGALTGRRFDGTIPGVKWAIPDAPAPNVDGGAVEVSWAGAMRPTTAYNPGTGTWATAPYTIGVETANATVAFTA